MGRYRTSATTASTDRPGLLIADRDGFTWCEFERRAQIDLDLDQTLALLGSRPHQATSSDIAEDHAWQPAESFTAHWNRPLAMTVDNGCALTYLDATGEWVELGPAHLRVIAAMQGDSDSALFSSPPTDIRAALDDLARAGTLRVLPVHSVEPEVMPLDEDPIESVARVAPSAAPALPLRAIVRGLTRKLRRPPTPTPSTSSNVDAPATEPTDSVPLATIELDSEPAATSHRQMLDDQRDPSDGRTPVYSFWLSSAGPPLGVAAVVAYARVRGTGHLTEAFDLRQIDRADSVIAALEQHRGPAVVLSGNYEWSISENLDVTRAAQAANPNTVVIHGGPSTPIDPAASEAFLRALPPGNIAVVGEGEITFAEVLECLTTADDSDLRTRIEAVAGLPGTRVLVDDRYIEGPARVRHDHLEDFPSALASGELDLIPHDELSVVAIETNRGCPYSCTFCDWGSATMSRVRKFPMDRVLADLDWLMSNEVSTWYVADANFGILKRDVEIASLIAQRRNTSGYPKLVVAFPAKNSTPRYIEILDTLISAGIAMKAAIALQTRDTETLLSVRRSNIRTESYDLLATESRRRSLPLLTELMIGLPGATVESLKADLQWCIDRQIRAFIYPTVILPNAPMSSAEYREEMGIETSDNMIVATSSYTAEEREYMDRIVAGYHYFEVFGSLRHVLRYLQWDHDMPAMDLVDRIVSTVDEAPDRYPLVAFHLRHFEDVLLPPVGWGPFLAQARDLLVNELGVADDSGLDTAFAVTQHLLLWPGRQLPSSADFDHDYLAYFRSAGTSLLETGEPGVPDAPLVSYGPGSIDITADPFEVAAMFGRWNDNDPFQQAFDYELASPLVAYTSTQAVSTLAPSA